MASAPDRSRCSPIRVADARREPDGVLGFSCADVGYFPDVPHVGTPLGTHDLIVAAHAVERRRTIASLDAHTAFSDLPGVLARSP